MSNILVCDQHGDVRRDVVKKEIKKYGRSVGTVSQPSLVDRHYTQLAASPHWHAHAASHNGLRISAEQLREPRCTPKVPGGNPARTQETFELGLKLSLSHR